MESEKIVKKIKILIKRLISHPHFPTGLAFLLLAIFLVTGSYASRPSRGRRLTSSPLLWAKLDGSLTDENSAGSVFAYSVGKSSSGSDYGITLKEGDNIQYGPGAAIDAGSDVYENWNPNQGTMNVWVQPSWSGNDNEAHWIWSADSGRIDTADANLVAYWKFDEGSENFASDSSSNSNVGYLHGPALSFDGGDYVQVPYNATLKLGNSGTIELWVKFDSVAAGTHNLVSYGGSSYNNGFLVNQEENDIWCYWMSGSANIYPETNLSTNKWYHIAVTNSSGSMALYIDGSSVGTGTSGGAITNDYVTYIGRTATVWGTNGQIDEVRIYSRALSATEVGQHYAGTFADESGLAGYWNMDDGQGQTVADSSGNNNNGTLGADSGSSTDDPAWVNYAPRWTEEGRFGEALIFDGSDDEVEINDINF